MPSFYKTLDALGYRTYEEYRQSPTWRNTIAKVFQRDNGLCLICSKGAEVVHHQSYDHDTLAGFDLSQLVSLCHQCHDKAHFNGNHRRKMREVRACVSGAIKRHRSQRHWKPDRPTSNEECPKCGRLRRAGYQYCKKCCKAIKRNPRLARQHTIDHSPKPKRKMPKPLPDPGKKPPKKRHNHKSVMDRILNEPRF